MAKIEKKKYFTIITLVDLYFWKIFSQIGGPAKKKLGTFWPKNGKTWQKFTQNAQNRPKNYLTIITLVYLCLCQIFSQIGGPAPIFFVGPFWPKKGQKLPKLQKMAKLDQKIYLSIITLVDLCLYQILSQIGGPAPIFFGPFWPKKMKNIAKFDPKWPKSTKKNIFHDNHTC